MIVAKDMYYKKLRRKFNGTTDLQHQKYEENREKRNSKLLTWSHRLNTHWLSGFDLKTICASDDRGV